MCIQLRSGTMLLVTKLAPLLKAWIGNCVKGKKTGSCISVFVKGFGVHVYAAPRSPYLVYCDEKKASFFSSLDTRTHDMMSSLPQLPQTRHPCFWLIGFPHHDPCCSSSHHLIGGTKSLRHTRVKYTGQETTPLHG